MLAWVVGVCGMPVWLYLLAFVLPGASRMERYVLKKAIGIFAEVPE